MAEPRRHHRPLSACEALVRYRTPPSGPRDAVPVLHRRLDRGSSLSAQDFLSLISELIYLAMFVIAAAALLRTRSMVALDTFLFFGVIAFLLLPATGAWECWWCTPRARRRLPRTS